jgi:carbon-monoxide dehydrogenase large subunit
MEARASLASYDAALGELTIWATSAGVHGVRGKVAEALGLGESKVRAIAPDIGGSFGAKNSTYPEDLAISALARKLGRPVKFTELRPEHLSSSKPGRDQIHYLDVAVRKDGRILGLRDRIVADLGAASTVDNSVSSAFLYVPGAYDVQVYQADAYGVATNKAPHGSLRGIGKADAALTLERVVDIIARKLGLDPAEVRFKNFVPEDAFPYKTATGALLDSGRYETCLKKALELAGYDELRQEQAALDRPGVRRGIGMSLVIEPTSAARRRFGGGYASCHIRMEPSGRVAVYPNIGQQGQGHQTTITQIVADRLNIPADQIDVFESDTAYTAYGPGTGSSRSSVTLMPAAMVAADLLKDKLLKIAGQVLEIDPDDLRIEGDAIRAVGLPDRSVAVREVARIAYHEVWMLPPGLEPALEMTGYFLNPNINYHPDERGRHNEFSAYPYEAVVAAVDVDLQTGAVEIVKYVSVHDCGTMLNPRIVQTQHIGCIAQGIGLALYEEMRFDEDGQLINSTFMDYLIPTVNEMPELILDHLETPTPFTPLGAKGAGETGALSPPAALGNAIQDALAPLGVELRETPYTPASLRRLIKAAAAGAPAGEQTLAAGGSARD